MSSLADSCYFNSAARDGGSYNMEFLIEAEITCPHCGETFPLQIDTSEPEQSLIEDCTVCCRPINLTVRCRPGEIIGLVVT